MIRFIYGDTLKQYPQLGRGMFCDRAAQFRQRLGWNVHVDADGLERDEYDDLNPLYVIEQGDDGGHRGSMRFLPTTGPVMVNDHFGNLTKGVAIQSPLIWECTRFCLAPGGQSARQTAARLMLAAAEMGQRFHLAHAVGVFDAHMVRVYRAIGWAPEVLGTSGTGRDAISAGLWDFDQAPLSKLRARAGYRAFEADTRLICA